MSTSKRAGVLAGILAGIGGLFQHIWSHGVADEVTNMAVGSAKFLRKKVGETTEDAKTNTADDDLWDMVLQIAEWNNLKTTAKDIRKYCHSLKNSPETHEHGCALVLFIAKKMVRSFERWEKAHTTQKPKTGKGKTKGRSSLSDYTEFAPYIEGIKLSSLWLSALMEVPEKDRTTWMENEGVFDLIAPKKPPGFFTKVWDNKVEKFLWTIFGLLLLLLLLKNMFS
jgi:hypothetical protein